jgi:hypothetical protein
MEHLKTLVKTAGIGLVVAGVFCSVIYGFSVGFIGLAAAGVIMFALGPSLLAYFLPGSPASTSPPTRSGWGRSQKTPEKVQGDPVGSAEKVVEKLQDIDPDRETPARAVKGRTWQPQQKGPGWLSHLPRSRHKFRIPGFRQFKRGIAVVCVVLNFLMGEFSLTSPGNTVFSIFFLASSFLLADYVWKTRHKPGGPEE